MFLAPPSYSWALNSSHHFLFPPILFLKVDPTWCPALDKLQVALIWSSLWVLPWVHQYHFYLASFVLLSSDVLFVAGLFALVWTCSACSCLENTKFISCACVRHWDNIRLMLARFAIASLSSIATLASVCSASAVLTWDSVACVWFSDAPYPWAADVAFLQIW